jgi:hypothetical protein
MEDINIGQRVGTSIIFSGSDRDSIRKLLATEGIDVETTQLGQWQELN